MVERKMCRICLAKDNLSSVFDFYNGEVVLQQINYICGDLISSSDNFPKYVCHQCLSAITIASMVKKKALATDNMLKDIFGSDDDVQEIHDDETDVASKYLAYEEQ